MEHMDKIDKQIKQALGESLNKQKLNVSQACPTDQMLADYISGGLSQQDKACVEKHASGCKACLDKISFALKAETLFEENKFPDVSEPTIEKTIKSLQLNKTPNQETNKLTQGPAKRKNQKNIWLLATIGAFGLSFVFPRYFLQCLTATIILGIKWIAESENMRTLILVLDSWRKHQHNDDNEISERLTKRNNNIKILK